MSSRCGVRCGRYESFCSMGADAGVTGIHAAGASACRSRDAPDGGDACHALHPHAEQVISRAEYGSAYMDCRLRRGRTRSSGAGATLLSDRLRASVSSPSVVTSGTIRERHGCLGPKPIRIRSVFRPGLEQPAATAAGQGGRARSAAGTILRSRPGTWPNVCILPR
jgi:hypothetical protein